MSLQNKAVAVAACFAAAALSWHSASAADFTFNEKTNADLAKKLKIPVYFAVPKSTWAKLPDIKTTDKLVEFSHPDGTEGEGRRRPAPRRRQALGSAAGGPERLATTRRRPTSPFAFMPSGWRELDQLVGGLDVGELRPGALRHGEVDGDLQLLGEVRVRLLVEGEVGGAGAVPAQGCGGETGGNGNGFVLQ